MILYKYFIIFRHILQSLLLIFIFLFVAGLSSIHADEQVVKIGVYENPPKIFTSESGMPDGIFIDIIEDIASKKGWHLQYVSGTWAEGLERLEKSQIDLMPDVAFTAFRNEIFDFHKEPVLSDWFQVYAHEDSGIKSILDLDGKRVLVLEGSIQQETFIQLTSEFGLNISLITTQDYKKMFEQVAAGDADAAITNRFFGLMHAADYGLENTAVIFSPAKLYYAAPKGCNENILDSIDSYLVKEKKIPDSVYYSSLKKWTREDVDFTFPVWFKIVGILSAVVILISLLINVLFKRQVNTRSAENAKLTIAIEHSPVAIMITDPDAIITYVNPAFSRITGYSSEEAVGQNVNILKSGKTSPIVYEDLSRTISTGNTWHGEWTNKKKNGKYYLEHTVICPIINEKGQIKNYLAIKEDITELKNAEHERIRRQIAEEANHAKSAFLSNMSHEIRTPMNAIIGFSQILQRDSSLGSKQREQIQIISRSSNHLLQLINNVLDLSKIEAGQVRLGITDFSLPDLLDELRLMFSLPAGDKGIELIFDIEENVPKSIASDEGKLRQILINLIGNSLKFTEKGSITVRVKTEIIPDNLNLVVEVEDTGPGISDEEKERIFDSFQQAEAGQKFGGTGLGLSISQNLVRIMGGSIEVSSHPGQGSIFCLHIPVTTEKTPCCTISELKNMTIVGLEQETGTLRILVVDNEPDNRSLLRTLLESAGFEVKEACNSKEALEIFSQWRPNGVLLELYLPGMDGYEVIWKIRAMTIGNDSRIIAVTASSFEEDEITVLSAGFDGYIRKPFKQEELLKVLGKTLNLNYVFAEKELANTETTEPRHLTSEDIALLPDDLIAAMRLTVEKGNMLEFKKLVTRVEKDNPQVSRGLNYLAGQYDYEKLKTLLKIK